MFKIWVRGGRLNQSTCRIWWMLTNSTFVLRNWRTENLSSLLWLCVPPCVSDHGVVRCVDHGGIIHSRKLSVNQVKVVQSQQRRPDCFYLHVGEVFSNATMTTCERSQAQLTVISAVPSLKVLLWFCWH